MTWRVGEFDFIAVLLPNANFLHLQDEMVGNPPEARKSCGGPTIRVRYSSLIVWPTSIENQFVIMSGEVKFNPRDVPSSFQSRDHIQNLSAPQRSTAS
jgi:hypothetical protein